MVAAVEIALLIVLVILWAVHWRAQRRLTQRIDDRDVALFKKHKALARDTHRTQLAAEQSLEETRSLHESNKSVLSDPRVRRLLDERQLPE